MRRVRTDFKSRRAVPKALWWVLAGVVALEVAAGTLLWMSQRELDTARRQLSQATADRQAKREVSPAPARPPPYLQSAQALLAEREPTWARVLDVLEATQVVGVTPTAVDVTSGDSMRVEVSFFDHAHLLQYVDELNGVRSSAVNDLQWRLIQATRTGDQPGTASVSVRVRNGLSTSAR